MSFLIPGMRFLIIIVFFRRISYIKTPEFSVNKRLGGLLNL